MLLGGKLGCSRAVYSGSRLRVVDDGKHLTALNVISFVSPDLDNVPHHLAGGVAGLGGTHRAYRFQQIGHVGLLHCEHGNVAHGFWRRSRAALLARAAGKAKSREEQHERKAESFIHIHGITTGDCGFRLPLANTQVGVAGLEVENGLPVVGLGCGARHLQRPTNR